MYLQSSDSLTGAGGQDGLTHMQQLVLVIHREALVFLQLASHPQYNSLDSSQDGGFKVPVK